LSYALMLPTQHKLVFGIFKKTCFGVWGYFKQSEPVYFNKISST
jgi:hypothetical protein